MESSEIDEKSGDSSFDDLGPNIDQKLMSRLKQNVHIRNLKTNIEKTRKQYRDLKSQYVSELKSKFDIEQVLKDIVKDIKYEMVKVNPLES